MVAARSINGKLIFIHKNVFSAKFGDFGQNYRHPSVANGLKLSVGAKGIRRFYKITTRGVGNSGGPDAKNPKRDRYMVRISPKIEKKLTLLAKIVDIPLSRMA